METFEKSMCSSKMFESYQHVSKKKTFNAVNLMTKQIQ